MPSICIGQPVAAGSKLLSEPTYHYTIGSEVKFGGNCYYTILKNQIMQKRLFIVSNRLPLTIAQNKR